MTDPPEGIRPEELDALRRKIASEPDNPDWPETLARLLETEANAPPPRGRSRVDEERPPVFRRDLSEALALYTRAARRSRLRIDRAAFYVAAADVAGNLGDPELEYRLLKAAAREMPHYAPVWRELQAACLRTGRERESQQAHQRFLRASFPVPRRPEARP